MPDPQQQNPQQQMVNVFSPDGTRGQIPKSQQDGAFTNGGFRLAVQGQDGSWTPVQPVSVTRLSDGQGGWMPVTQAKDALANGFRLGPPSQQKYNDTTGSGLNGQSGIDPYLSSAWQNVRQAAASTGNVLKIGGGTLLKMAANPTPAGMAAAIGDEAAQQQQAGGIPQSSEVIAQPLRELAGVRQPNESVTLGFTNQAGEQQPLATRTMYAMSSLMGGNPQGARLHAAKAMDAQARGDSQTANQENQAAVADLTAVPASTVGFGRLVGASGDLLSAASRNAGMFSDAGTLARLRILPSSMLSSDEAMTRLFNPYNPLKGGSSADLLSLHGDVQSALPRIKQALADAGVQPQNVSAADIQDAINTAKRNLLTEHQAVMGPDETLADMGPNQQAVLNGDLDSLDRVQGHLGDLQAEDAAAVAKAASKGRSIPTTASGIANKAATGIGKYAAARAIGTAIPFGGPVARATLHAAGVTSGFSDLTDALRGLLGQGTPAGVSPLDASLQDVFSKGAPDLADVQAQRAVQAATQPTGADPFAVSQPGQTQQDLTVQHTSNIYPPNQPFGYANLIQALQEGARRQPAWAQMQEVIAPQPTPYRFGPGAIASEQTGPTQQPNAGVLANNRGVIVRPQGPQLALPGPQPALALPERTGIALPAQSDSTLAQTVAMRRLFPISGDPATQAQAIRDFLARNPNASPAQQLQYIFGQLDENMEPVDLGGMADVPSGRMPATAGITGLAGPYRGFTEDALTQFQQRNQAAMNRQVNPITQQELDANMAAANQQPEPFVSNGLRTRPVQPTLDSSNLIDALQQMAKNKGQGFVERRQNAAFRQQVSQMTPDQVVQALFTSDKTGLPNYRAFQASASPDLLGDTHPHVGFADVDDFKNANTVLGEQAVDQKVLPAIGDAFQEAKAQENGAVQVFHRAGDSFVMRATDPAAVTRAVQNVNQILKDAKFEIQKPDGSVVQMQGVGLSHGTGIDEATAESASKLDKASRRSAGLRIGARDTDVATQPGQAVQPLGSPNPTGQQVTQSDFAQRQGVLAQNQAPTQGATIAGQYGNETTVLTPNGQYPGKYKVVEADSLTPSHDPMTFARNPEYPANVQERAYDTSKEAQQRVIQQAQNFEPAYVLNNNPDAVNGPPIMTPDGVVLGGNSRTMSTQRLYATGDGRIYRDALAQNAGQFGITPDQLSGFKNPVLVREVGYPATVDDTRRLASDLNKSMTGALGNSEKAVSAGRNLSTGTLGNISDMLNDLGDNASLRDLMRERGGDMLRMLSDDGVITDRERPQFVDTSSGGLNDEGKQFVERALMGSVVDDPRLMDTAPKNVMGKLERSLGDLSSLGSRADEYNILPLVREAIADHAQAASKGMTIGDFLGQNQMFGPPRNPAVDAITRTLAGRPKDVQMAFRQFAQDANFDVQNQPTLGMTETPTPARAFNSAFGTNLTDDQIIESLLQSLRKEGKIREGAGNEQTGQTVANPAPATGVSRYPAAQAVTGSQGGAPASYQGAPNPTAQGPVTSQNLIEFLKQAAARRGQR